MSKITADAMRAAVELAHSAQTGVAVASIPGAVYIAKAIMAERKRCMKAICSGCASGVRINDLGYHQHNLDTFPCQATAIRGDQ